MSEPLIFPNEERRLLQKKYRIDEVEHVKYLLDFLQGNINQEVKSRVRNVTIQIVEKTRDSFGPTLVDKFMQQYNFSSAEGLALMCLAEALLRIPDKATVDDLIRDKLSQDGWKDHFWKSDSAMVNTSTVALCIASKVIDFDSREKVDFFSAIRGVIKKCGLAVTRVAISKGMAMLGEYFVFAEDISKAVEKSESNSKSSIRFFRDVLNSFDMLGEGALTKEDSKVYFDRYSEAIHAIGKNIKKDAMRGIPEISVKLSAIYNKYEIEYIEDVMSILLPRVIQLCVLAKNYGIGVCIDAEESRRLEISMMIIEAARMSKELEGWEGLGLAVQAYQKRAESVLEFIKNVSIRSKHKIRVRLVKGAYIDQEIKYAGERGLSDYPVFTKKVHTDLNYLYCAYKLLHEMSENIFPCFATHNVQTFVSIMEMLPKGFKSSDFEFQYLYGMGQSLYRCIYDDLGYDIVIREYAPIGQHSALLPYLIRRMLENNSVTGSFNKLQNLSVDSSVLAESPIDKIASVPIERSKYIPLPLNIFSPERKNSVGFDISDSVELEKFAKYYAEHGSTIHRVGYIVNGVQDLDEGREITSPFSSKKVVAVVKSASVDMAVKALTIAHNFSGTWKYDTSVDIRASALEKAADMLEERMFEFFTILINEGGKTLKDAIAEVREAVDFLRYYAVMGRKDVDNWVKLNGYTGEENYLYRSGIGVFLCISPWNFPLAIFIGQIAAALVAGNTVLAKSAEQTPVVAYKMINLLYEAGIPHKALHFLPGSGREIGGALIPDERISGVVFTGSNEVAFTINKMLSERKDGIIPFIAETGGINSMIADSSALCEQVANDVIASAFQSAGQRCSALRVLFLMEEDFERKIKMISGAMQDIKVGDPSILSTDVGPVIDQGALKELQAHVAHMRKNAVLLAKSPDAPEDLGGNYIAPHMFEIQSIKELPKEVFGPILHVIRYKKTEMDSVVKSINDTKYGLTFALHSRILGNVNNIAKKVNAGNIYINRNQIGAIVNLQPFGGLGLSGTGPKAGGPDYVKAFTKERTVSINTAAVGGDVNIISLDM